jgi:hypothetical protein
MMARRAQAAEGEAPIRQQTLGGVDGPPGRVQRRLPGAGAGDGVEVDHPASARRDRLDLIDVSRVVDPLELFPGGFGGLHQLEAEPVALRHRLLDRGQPPGALGVPAGVVLERARMSKVEARDQVPHSNMDRVAPRLRPRGALA